MQTISTEDKFTFGWPIIAQKGIGNSYGYRVHNTMLKKYVEKIVKLSDDAEDWMMIQPLDKYSYKEGHINWLFSMFEGDGMSGKYMNESARADFMITPSNWVRDVFLKHFPGKEVFVVNHGVEPFWSYRRRKKPGPGQVFRFLWVGAPNARKGFEEVISAWTAAKLHLRTDMELYLKSTILGRLEKKFNIVLDYRDLPKWMLLDIYHKAHCFLLPTRGEGFGLTLAEAMRTGLPCIATNHTGVTDFFNEDVGYPINFEIKDDKVCFVGRPDIGEIKTKTCHPDVQDLILKMDLVYSRYDEALDKGLDAHRWIRDNFTWEKSAQKLVGIIRSKWEERHR